MKILLELFHYHIYWCQNQGHIFMFVPLFVCSFVCYEPYPNFFMGFDVSFMVVQR